MIKKKFLVLVTITGLVTSGCATIVHGTKQDVYVTSNPSGAVVRMQGIATTTPGVLTLDRKHERYVLVFEKEGYQPVEIKLRRTIDGWFFGNLLIGGLVGIVIDFVNGSAYKLTPGEVDVVFGETGANLKRFKKGDIAVFVDMDQIKSMGITPTQRIM